MASNDSHALGLTTAERALLDLAADDRRDTVSFAPQEELLLQLYDKIQELELERAILEQDLEEPSTDDVEDQLAVAERELLEARATLTVRRKAIESILMTDPILKAVHLKAGSPAERALLPVVNRRDLTSLIYENLANARTATLKELTSAEVDNLQLLESNQALTTELLAVSVQETSWRDRISDDEVIQQVEAEEQEYRKVRAQRDTLKSVVSALVVGSGIDWARDEKLRDLVLDEVD